MALIVKHLPARVNMDASTHLVVIKVHKPAIPGVSQDEGITNPLSRTSHSASAFRGETDRHWSVANAMMIARRRTGARASHWGTLRATTDRRPRIVAGGTR